MRSEPPMTIYELKNYLLVGIVSMAGLYYGLREGVVRALASASVGLLLFSAMWGSTLPGFTLMVKSLHYFGLLLAMGSAFFFAILLKYRVAGKALTVFVLALIIHASYFGTAMALNGLGAYHAGELAASSHLLSLPIDVRLVGDTKASYLFKNYFGVGVRSLGSKGALLLLKGNEYGFLIGYDWMPSSLKGPKDRVVDFGYLRLIL